MSVFPQRWKHHLALEVEWVKKQGLGPVLDYLPQEKVIMALTLTLVKGVCERAPLLLRNLFSAAVQFINPTVARWLQNKPQTLRTPHSGCTLSLMLDYQSVVSGPFSVVQGHIHFLIKLLCKCITSNHFCEKIWKCLPLDLETSVLLFYQFWYWKGWRSVMHRLLFSLPHCA